VTVADRETPLGQRSCPPSELTLLGLVRHRTEIERNYFAAWAGVTDLPHDYSDADPDGDFHLPDPVTVKGSPLRWVLVYVLREYARHNLHADLLREAIDGATGE
jgi:hypothetical protein